MKNKWMIGLGLLLIAGGIWFFLRSNSNQSTNRMIREVSPEYGPIEQAISVTATVQPQNRLEIKPPINGRVDKIFVKEGDMVKVGDVLASMSSTERAALLDAARKQGEKQMSYWEEAYKAIPLVAPIDGEVIVQTVQPGQTVTQSDAIVVLSDRLIVQAQVDETDIGKVAEGQQAVITLDAYPEIKVPAAVQHIYHESKLVNNVTIYLVDILPKEIPHVFRSGMSANVRIVEGTKESALLVPVEAIKNIQGEKFVLVNKDGAGKPVRKKVETGIADEAKVEILSGLDPGDKVVIESRKYVPAQTGKTGSNPFAPSYRQKKPTQSGS